MAEKYVAEEYEIDEFDRIAQGRAISGAHREEKKSHKWFIALIIVIICAPIAGIGIGYGLSVVRTGLSENQPTVSAPEKVDTDATAADEE